MLKAGAAQVVITPPVGAPLSGYFLPRKSVGVLDDLCARALVLESEGVTVALLSCDLKSIRYATVQEARSIIHAECGIPPSHVLVCCSHTHTGPYPSRTFSCSPDPDYLRMLPRYLAGAVVAAHHRMHAARIGIGTGRVDGIAFNRRYRMADGGVRTNPGTGNPAIVEPAGPVDPTLGVIRVEREDGSLLAAWVNYTVHTDMVSGCLISADYPGELARTLQKQYSPEVVVLYANGACGDINHIDVHGPPGQSGMEHAARIGRVLAAETMRVLETTATTASCPIRVAEEIISLPLREISPTQLQEARQLCASITGGAESGILHSEHGSPSVEAIFARGVLEVAEEREREPAATAPVQAIRLGEAAVLAQPSELFVEYGLRIKAASPFQPTFVVGYANGMVGYVPTRRAFEEGGYETRLCRSSKLVPESGDLLVTAAARLLRRVDGTDDPQCQNS